MCGLGHVMVMQGQVFTCQVQRFTRCLHSVCDRVPASRRNIHTKNFLCVWVYVSYDLCTKYAHTAERVYTLVAMFHLLVTLMLLLS